MTLNVAETTLNTTRDRILHCARKAFLERGYDTLTMAGVAEVCGLSRRALYNYYGGKEELFRDVLARGNLAALDVADLRAETLLAKKADATTVIAGWLDARFGETRREIGASPHGRELNSAAFRLCLDVMVEVSHETNRRLSRLVERLRAAGALALRNGFDPDKVARLVSDGARGVNQDRPPVPNARIATRYAEITDAILYGCAADGPERR